MVTMYSPDTNSIIKALSDSLHINSTAPSQISRKRRIKKSHLLEISKSASQSEDDLELSACMLSWFCSLAVPSRLNVLSLQNSFTSTFIRQMYIKKLTEGDYEFAMVDNIPKQYDQEITEDHFLFRRKPFEGYSYTDPKFQAEKNFEQIIRLTDTEEYLDTLTVDPEMAKYPEKLIDLIKSISNKQAFIVPCRCFWDSSLKRWMWEYPSWFSSTSYNSLASWVSAGFERAIWMKYWMLNGLDPRKQGETQNFVAEEAVGEDSQQNQLRLTEFIGQLNDKTKFSVVGEIDELTKIFVAVKSELANLSKDQINTWAYPQIARFPYFNSMATGIFAYCNPLMGGFHINALRNKIQYYQTAKSVEIIIQKLQSDTPEKFIEFLSSSPLDRAVTYLDIVTRKVLLRIKSALTEKNAEDLLKLEENQTVKGKKSDENKKKKKKKKKHNKAKQQQNAQTIEQTEQAEKAEKSDREDEESEVVKNLLENIMETLYAQIQKIELNSNSASNDSEDTQVTDEPLEFKEAHMDESQKEEFKRVEIHKKKAKKQQQPKYKKNNHKRPNTTKPNCQSSENKYNKSSPKNKQQSPKKNFQWQSPTTTAQSATLSSDIEFPPLTSSCISPKVKHKLHQEIIKFGKEITKFTNAKSPVIYTLMNNLNEWAWKMFPVATVQLFGSYGSGLALDDSDIDLAITNVGLFDRASIQQACAQLGESLMYTPWVSKCTAITTATIPVVKLEVNPKYLCEDQEEGRIMVDVTFDDSYDTNMGTHLGLSSLMMTQSLVGNYPHFREIALVLKKLLYSHSLNSLYHGGLSSYSLTLWIAAYMNSSGLKEDLGETLLGFLDFFGNKFDPKKTGINVINGGAFYSLQENNYEITVTIDPINLENNTTRSSYRIQEVLKLFSWAHSKLEELTRAGNSKEILKQIFKG
ncbi:unnamed protein product [Blepharisma stoltei]|uniref:Polymerase nucleotidyl transferase domain-containing protein n=1 Tax=Blepharisma stoltei TaxID=1481888 RepID=A0AAU9IND0_9CILI|nr:unnamed protein product [Blepharisma stoltei]